MTYRGNSNRLNAGSLRPAVLLSVLLIVSVSVLADDCTKEPTKGEAVACLQARIGALAARLGRIHVQRVVGPQPAAIDNEELLSLCGDEDGCDIAIGYRNIRNPDGTYIPAIRWGPPCRFHIDRASHSWAIANHCYATFKILREKKDDNFTIYSSGGFGADGDGARFQVLMYWTPTNPVCQLSEDVEGGSDSDIGFYFFMSTPSEPDPLFSNPKRTCELLITD